MSRSIGPRAATLVLAIVASAFATGSAVAADTDLLAKGEYLLNAGDCVSCHTAPGGKPLAGGLKVTTPFGPMVTPNITPDKDTGIGSFTDDQFYRAMHEGIGARGEYLYPVFPFPWYTKVTRDDALAIKAYLFSLPAVHAEQATNQLSFPFNIRASLAGWREAFFKAEDFKPDPAKSAEVNRGAYLVEGLGHCAECHTPHNVAGASVDSKAYQGAAIDGWYAPNISSDMVEGIGSWSQEQLLAYLKTGTAPGKGIVAGPMAQVVHESLSKLTDADVTDIALYLKQLPAKQAYPPSQPAPATAATSTKAAAYVTFCASCHQQDGRGVSGVIPALDGNGSVLANGPEDVLKVVVGGLSASGSYAAMPAIGAGMTDQQVADATNFVRSAWSNKAPQNAGPGGAGTARSIDTMLSGGTCATSDAAVLDTSADVPKLLADITDANMLDKVQAIVAKTKPSAPRADVVNSLTAMYCPVIAHAPGVTRAQKAQSLARFAQLTYTALVQGGKS